MHKITLQSLKKIPTLSLREIKGEIIKDYIICINDNVTLENWLQDLNDEPDAYSYTSDELEEFIFMAYLLTKPKK
jgi:hypothetical protein